MLYKILSGLFIIITIGFIGIWVMLKSYSQSSFITITSNNIENLELGYAVPGFCLFGGTSPDGEFIFSNNFYGTDNGIYRASSGQLLFVAPASVSFDPKSEWIYLQGDGIYTYPDWDKHMDIMAERIFFSNDWSYFFIPEVGLYNLQTRALVLSSNGDSAIFSANNNYIAIRGDGIYQMNSLQYLLPFPNNSIFSRATFSPNEQWIAINDIGIYDLQTLQNQWILPESEFDLTFEFSPNSDYLSIYEAGVFDVTTGEKLIDTFTLGAVFTSDSNQVILSDGVYDLLTGDKQVDLSITTVHLSSAEQFIISEAGIFDIESGRDANVHPYGTFLFEDSIFITSGNMYSTANWSEIIPILGNTPTINRDKTLVTTALGSYGDYPTGSSCLVYGIEGNNWAYRSGIGFTTNPIEVYSHPNASESFELVSGKMILYAQTSDFNWFKILLENTSYGWIKAEDIEFEFITDGIPIEIFD